MTQLSLPDPRKNTAGLFRRDGSSTMKYAAEKIYPKTGTQRWKVLNAIAIAEGMTDDELQQVLRLPGNSERPRRVELVRGGWVKASEKNRVTQADNPAIVWVLTDKAQEEWAAAL